ncbi:MAG: efflux RND transporter periplasmic adaptor subunit [Gammaproteobacteria bacterium]|nr:efflux RND transporter periplasmic adaptor subunit [Gammaproteobacteria bacterium]
MQRGVILAAALWSLSFTGWAAELETVVAEQRDLPRTRLFDATVEAVNRGTVTAETSGTVQELLFDVDDYVEAGAVLVRFRDNEPRARAEAARASLAEARAQLAQAEQEFQRVSEIFQRKLVAKSSLDAATAARDTARARVAAARARLAESESQLEKSVVRAPYNGIVTARHIEVGEAAQPGTPLLSGLSLERLRVSVQVPQSVVKSLRESPRAEVRLDGREAWPLADLTLFPGAHHGAVPGHARQARRDARRGATAGRAGGGGGASRRTDRVVRDRGGRAHRTAPGAPR